MYVIFKLGSALKKFTISAMQAYAIPTDYKAVYTMDSGGIHLATRISASSKIVASVCY